MTVNRKPTGTAVSIPAGLSAGALVSAGITIAGTLLTAKLIDSEVLLWNHCGYAVMAILMVSSWAGAMVCAGRIKRQRLLMCLASGGIYFSMLLLATALFFGGQYSGVGEPALLIFCGCMLGSFVGLGGKKGRKGRKIRLRNC